MNSVYLAWNNHLNHKSVLNAGSGASEFQICLLAKQLSINGFNVTCFNRSGIYEKIDNILYRDYNDLIYNKNIEKDVPLIFWRFFDIVPNIIKFYNPKRLIVWSHDYKGIGLSEQVSELINNNKIQVVAVSEFHKNSLKINKENISVIYNALYTEVYRYDDKIEVDKNSITFASAWKKGLDVIIKLFDNLYAKYPNFYLNVLSPSYGKINLPSLINKPYIRLHDVVRDKKIYSSLIQSSLCVVSTEFPETFGCTFAESYYLKTPVIATNLINGMHEFINNEYTCDLKSYEQFEKLLLSFYYNRPKVSLSENFLETKVLDCWENLINRIRGQK